MNPNLSKFLITGAVGIVGVLILAVITRGQEAAERATVTINDQTLEVRVADNPWERHRGLSGLEAEDVKAQGMLFVFPDEEVRDFWMKGMKLDLDVLWIKDDKVVSLQTNLKAPAAGEEPTRFTSNPIPVEMVLELPAGYVQQLGILAGQPIKIELP